MKNLQKTIAAIAFATLIFSSNIFAQSATAPVTINLKKALGITNEGGNLTFGDLLVTGTAQAPSIANGSGVRFLVTGHPGKDVTISFDVVTLDNDQWVSDNGGSGNGTMDFTPTMDETGSSQSYAAGSAVTTGNTFPLVNLTGTGNLNLWVGGSIAVGANQAHGDYEGTLTVSVSY